MNREKQSTFSSHTTGTDRNRHVRDPRGSSRPFPRDYQNPPFPTSASLQPSVCNGTCCIPLNGSGLHPCSYSPRSSDYLGQHYVSGPSNSDTSSFNSNFVLPKCYAQPPIHILTRPPSSAPSPPFLASFAQEPAGYVRNQLRSYSRQTLSSLRSAEKAVCSAKRSEETPRDGLLQKHVITGMLRINPKRFTDGYIGHPKGDADVYISGLRWRNHALPDDIVAVQIEAKKYWKVYDTFTQGSSLNKKKASRRQTSDEYVTLENFLAKRKHELVKLLGSVQVEQIIADITSSADPASCEGEHSPWWTVLQRTGRVVRIVHPLHNRVCIGYLQMPKNEQKSRNSSPYEVELNPVPASFARLLPTDRRIPMLRIPTSDCPAEFRRNPDAFKTVRFVARITDWPDDSLFPTGQLYRRLEDDGKQLVDIETDRILVGAGFFDGVDAVKQFPSDVEESALQAVSSCRSSFHKDLEHRKDLRNYCVFTIDPSTARDLDDALHFRQLSSHEIEALDTEGYKCAMYEVGVHIADVSYFVRPGSALDKEASRRATTIYLVQLCVPMLPRSLSEELCSLNPGEDKLTFSVLFTLNADGKVLKTSFSRSVIRSCAKLSYDSVQLLLDNPDQEEYPENTFVISQPHCLADVRLGVLKLHDFALQRRKARFVGGCLRLDNIKTCFILDEDEQFPIGVAPHLSKPSNWLVEEWMLAANEAVAHHLASHLPHSAFLRRHQAPSSLQLTKASENLAAVGIDVDVKTAGSIQASICNEAGCPVSDGYQYSSELGALCADLQTSKMDGIGDQLVEQFESISLRSTAKSTPKSFAQCESELELEARLLVALSVLTKAMNLAEYFCLGELDDGLTTDHYALNMRLYTHFTSPIRRYADIIVHRQLATILAMQARSLGNIELADWYEKTAQPPELDAKKLQIQAEICNSKKLAARQASEQSAELFFILLVKEVGPLTEVCAVLSVLDRSFDVLLLSCGLVRRVYLENLNLRRSESVSATRVGARIKEGPKLCLFWNIPDTGNGSLAMDPSSDRFCGCFYTEVKVLDVVQCQVSIDKCDDNVLPNLKVTLIRPSCANCA